MAGLTARGLPDAAAALASPSSSAVAHATLASWRSRCGLSPSPLLEASTNPSIVASNSKPGARRRRGGRGATRGR